MVHERGEQQGAPIRIPKNNSLTVLTLRFVDKVPKVVLFQDIIPVKRCDKAARRIVAEPFEEILARPAL